MKKYSFSKTASMYINFCHYLEDNLKQIYDSNKDVAKIIDLFFNDYYNYTLQWYMKEELERISKIHVGCLSSYFKNNEWNNENGHKNIVSNPIERVLIFITNFLQHDIDESFYDINELKFGVKFTFNENNDISVSWFSDENSMYECGYTNKASDYLEYLKKFAENKADEHPANIDVNDNVVREIVVECETETM